MKSGSTSASVGVPKKRAKTPPNLFGDDDENNDTRKDGDVNMDDEVDYDAAVGEIDDDNWVIDDTDGGLNDDDGEKQWAAREGVREMGMFFVCLGIFVLT